MAHRSLLAAALCALLPVVATGQETPKAPDFAAMVRGSGVIGLPDVTIDLERRAERRVAIVVGNSAYDFGQPLKNAAADARLMAEFLRGQGYLVLDRYDLGRRGFEDLLREALTTIPANSEVLFYFAGHGLQIGRKNFIVPVDADLSNARDVAYETVTLDNVVKILGARSRAQVVLLDSCRDNPFGEVELATGLSNQLFEGQDGFSPMTAPVNTLLAFSTSPGEVALDGAGENSPFTSAFVSAARELGDRPASSVLEQVRRTVYAETRGRQIPWESSTLVEPIYFGGAAARLAAMNAEPGAGGGAARSIRVMNAAAAKAAAAAQAQDAAAGEPAVLSAALEREIRLGDALRAALELPADAGLEIAALPERGRLAISGEAGWRSVGLGPVTGREMGSLTFNPAFGQVPAEGHDGLLTARFEVIAKGERRPVELQLQADPCDLAAGDYLDPEGVGLVRYPNEIRPQEALAACEAAVAAHPDEGRFHYQLGRAQVALRDFDAARASYDKARALEHTRAWYATGILEAQRPAATGGEAETRVSDEVLVWYVVGSEKGDPYAYHALGKQFVRHETSETLRAQGYDLLSRAIELGHTFAMNELGWIYLDKDGKWYDPVRGLRHLRESAGRDDIYGFNNLGLVHRNGLGDQPKNPEAALAWFRKASAGGHPNAPTNIGRMYAAGEIGGGPDPVEAIRWYDEGLSRGDAWGGANAAFLIARARPTGFGPADMALRAGKAAALRNPEARDAARGLLDKLPPKFLDQASQMLLREMGAEIEADGAFGPGSRAALEAVAAGAGETAPGGLSAAERLVWIAGLNWRQGSFRVDLY
ncbi:caspase family protein [Rhodovulum sp. DZ06]|uniref:caspase family protein n=1 Tax=Rhodovulum sp. DZ06 TaxID=3425126 RepID=UPI003D3499BB